VKTDEQLVLDTAGEIAARNGYTRRIELRTRAGETVLIGWQKDFANHSIIVKRDVLVTADSVAKSPEYHKRAWTIQVRIGGKLDTHHTRRDLPVFEALTIAHDEIEPKLVGSFAIVRKGSTMSDDILRAMLVRDFAAAVSYSLETADLKAAINRNNVSFQDGEWTPYTCGVHHYYFFAWVLMRDLFDAYKIPTGYIVDTMSEYSNATNGKDVWGRMPKKVMERDDDDGDGDHDSDSFYENDDEVGDPAPDELAFAVWRTAAKRQFFFDDYGKSLKDHMWDKGEFINLDNEMPSWCNNRKDGEVVLTAQGDYPYWCPSRPVWTVSQRVWVPDNRKKLGGKKLGGSYQRGTESRDGLTLAEALGFVATLAPEGAGPPDREAYEAYEAEQHQKVFKKLKAKLARSTARLSAGKG
jgi:hypothetical protein